MKRRKSWRQHGVVSIPSFVIITLVQLDSSVFRQGHFEPHWSGKHPRVRGPLSLTANAP